MSRNPTVRDDQIEAALAFGPEVVRKVGWRGDALLVAVVGALHLIVLVAVHAFASEPAEDAAMLLRYAQHLAQGHGIVWNVGEAPIDGATDLLYMVAIAALNSVGVGLLAAAQALDVLGALGSIVVTYVAGRCLLKQSRGISLVGPTLIAIGPAALYTRVGFGAPFFGFTVALAAASAIAFVLHPRTSQGLTFGFSCLFMGLVRPEGALLGVFLIVAIVIASGFSRSLAVGIISGFIIPGLVYFLARWWYFGHPLPNPYYKKGAGKLHLTGLFESLQAAAWFLGAWLFYLLPLRAWSKNYRRWLSLTLPFVSFAVIWVLLSPEMNYHLRFQYPLLILFSVAFPDLWLMSVQAWSGSSRRRVVAVALAAALVVEFAGVGSYLATRHPDPVDARMAISEALAPTAGAGELLATTEAGLLPLESGWRTLDLWGLNDEQIAHDGLTVAMLDRTRPSLMLLHEDTQSRLPGWAGMLSTAHAYMDQNGRYQEVASWGAVDQPMVLYSLRGDSGSEKAAAAVRAVLSNGCGSARACSPR